LRCEFYGLLTLFKAERDTHHAQKEKKLLIFAQKPDISIPKTMWGAVWDVKLGPSLG